MTNLPKQVIKAQQAIERLVRLAQLTKLTGWVQARHSCSLSGLEQVWVYISEVGAGPDIAQIGPTQPMTTPTFLQLGPVSKTGGEKKHAC